MKVIVYSEDESPIIIPYVKTIEVEGDDVTFISDREQVPININDTMHVELLPDEGN